MNEKPLAIHEMANLTGVTTRTLRYYDKIDLLKPSIVTETRYRLYTQDDLCRLQEILFFREIGFALKEIRSLLNAPNYNRIEAMKKHLSILEAQRERLEDIISLVKDRINGSSEISFSAFSNSKVLELQAKYREEVFERWGNTDSLREFETNFSAKAQKLQQEELETYMAFAQNIFERLSMYEDEAPDCAEIQKLVHEWQLFISDHFYPCDKKMLSYLSNLYIVDDRFNCFINRFGTGDLASFFNQAICVYCSPKEAAEDEF
ncbi:MAG: MerR family transcriptional regulator [Oscillospiraceae bacterium]|nr:MerR family transcriptional regulator [Oscillospiraceae bacterium]